MTTENGKVTIVPDDNGNVIRVSKTNPEFGHVRLVQEKVGISVNGWVKKQSLSTLLHGKIEDLQTMNIADKKILSGKLVVREQLEAFSAADSDRDLKYAGDTGVICCQHGQPIYRKTFYSLDDTSEDILIAHTNSDAIREANGMPARTSITQEQLNNITEGEEKTTTKRSKKKKEEVVEDETPVEIEETKEEEIEVDDGSTFEL